jgi:hypothetical protein
MPDADLLSRENLHDSHRIVPSYAKHEIRRVLDKALKNFRNNKIEPHLSNLQNMLVLFSAFRSQNLSGFPEVAKDTSVDGEVANSMLRWVEENEHSDKLADVQEVVSWAYPKMIEVIREGLPVRQMVIDNSILYPIRKAGSENSERVIIIGHEETGRSYGFRYTVNSKGAKLAEELTPNFPLLQEQKELSSSVPIGGMSYSQLWHGDLNQESDAFMNKVGSQLENHESVFYFCSDPKFPFWETQVPGALLKLQSRLQGNVGQQSLF